MITWVYMESRRVEEIQDSELVNDEKESGKLGHRAIRFTKDIDEYFPVPGRVDLLSWYVKNLRPCHDEN